MNWQTRFMAKARIGRVIMRYCSAPTVLQKTVASDAKRGVLSCRDILSELDIGVETGRQSCM
jgi:hypothetical protein